MGWVFVVVVVWILLLLLFCFVTVSPCCYGTTIQARCFRLPTAWYLVRRCISRPWGGFSSSIARQPRGRQYQTKRLRKALGEVLPTPTMLATSTIPTVEMSSMESRPRGVWYTPSFTLLCCSWGTVRCHAVYGEVVHCIARLTRVRFRN